MVMTSAKGLKPKPIYHQVSEGVFELDDVILPDEVNLHEFDSELFSEKVRSYLQDGYSIQTLTSTFRRSVKFGGIHSYSATLVRGVACS